MGDDRSSEGEADSACRYSMPSEYCLPQAVISDPEFWTHPSYRTHRIASTRHFSVPETGRMAAEATVSEGVSRVSNVAREDDCELEDHHNRITFSKTPCEKLRILRHVSDLKSESPEFNVLKWVMHSPTSLLAG